MAAVNAAAEPILCALAMEELSRSRRDDTANDREII
jgi:hypothetical protein